MKKKTITVDLETWTPSVLNNITGGFHPGQMIMYSGGRQSGKSMYTKVLKNHLYGSNPCKEVMLTGLQLLQEFTINWGEPVSKYKFSRAKWYEGKFDWRKYEEVHNWCEQHFGKHPKRPDAWSRWNHMYKDMILFRDEKDYMLFVLRWS